MVQGGQMDGHELHLLSAKNGGGIASALAVACNTGVEVGDVGAGRFLDFIDEPWSADGAEQFKIVGSFGSAPVFGDEIGDAFRSHADRPRYAADFKSGSGGDFP